MAENKKSFVLYSDLIHTVEKLDDVTAGRLLKHILRYVNDQNPDSASPIIEIAFEPIKQSLKRDLVKWEGIIEGRSKAGKASAKARKKQKQQVLTNSTSVKSVEQIQQDSTNPTVSVSVSVSDKEKTLRHSTNDDKPSAKEKPKSSAATFAIFWEYYHKATGKPRRYKQEAINIWNQKHMTLEQRRQAYKGVESYFKWTMAEYNEIKFVKYCMTYLKARIWEGDYSNVSAKSKETATKI